METEFPSLASARLSVDQISLPSAWYSRRLYFTVRYQACWKMDGARNYPALRWPNAFRLSPAKSTTVQADLELDTVVLNSSGDFNTAALARKLNTGTIDDLIIRTYLYRAAERRSTLVFCVDLSHVDSLTQAFRTAGIDARSISSFTQPRVRRETIRGFGKGEFPVLVNCEVLTEGTDIPEVSRAPTNYMKLTSQIDCIILARPTRSRNLLAQMVIDDWMSGRS